MPGSPLHRLLRCAAMLLLLIATPALAGDPPERWVLRAGGTALMLFEIVPTPQGWTASWSQPTRYETDGRRFTRVSGPAVRRSARAVHVTPGAIDLVFDNPLPGGAPDRFAIRRRDASSARMIWAAYAATPFRLTRVTAAGPLGQWRSDATYAADIDPASDPEMTAIYDADQAARQDPATIDWTIVRAADRARRARTQALLTADRLASGDDFYHAAFVFQHGDTPDDYLKAHALAVVAVERGRAEATWIAAATLDRFLQSIDRPQIYGTQFHRPGTVFTQEPYDRMLLPDAVRQASRVPPLAAQEDQRREWERRVPLATAPPH